MEAGAIIARCKEGDSLLWLRWKRPRCGCRRQRHSGPLPRRRAFNPRCRSSRRNATVASIWWLPGCRGRRLVLSIKVTLRAGMDPTCQAVCNIGSIAMGCNTSFELSGRINRTRVVHSGCLVVLHVCLKWRLAQKLYQTIAVHSSSSAIANHG
jgi:hypothetical protein